MDRIGITVLDPIIFRFSHGNPAHKKVDIHHRSIIIKEKTVTAKLTMVVEALKEEAAPSKALTDVDVGDVPLVAIGELVSPASAAGCEAEA